MEDVHWQKLYPHGKKTGSDWLLGPLLAYPSFEHHCARTLSHCVGTLSHCAGTLSRFRSLAELQNFSSTALQHSSIGLKYNGSSVSSSFVCTSFTQSLRSKAKSKLLWSSAFSNILGPKIGFRLFLVWLFGWCTSFMMIPLQCTHIQCDMVHLL